jgi:hypothetical protein
MNTVVLFCQKKNIRTKIQHFLNSNINFFLSRIYCILFVKFVQVKIDICCLYGPQNFPRDQTKLQRSYDTLGVYVGQIELSLAKTKLNRCIFLKNSVTYLRYKK